MSQQEYEKRQTAIHMLRSGQLPVEVAQELERSLAWVYKWRRRFEQEGWRGLRDRSRAPQSHPNELPETVRQAIRQARSQLEMKAEQPGELAYIGAQAIQSRLSKRRVKPLPSITSIERVLRDSDMTRPRMSAQEPEIVYPHLHPGKPHQLIQVDIVTHFLPGGPCVACFNAIDVVSHYPEGQQFATRKSGDAAHFLIQVWQQLGIAKYTQVDNESCFSGGFTHPGVLGTVLRLALYVGTELIFSPIRHPESNAYVERFHQDYNQHVWNKLELPDLATVQLHSPVFFEAYRDSEHIAALQGHSPVQIHAAHPVLHLPADFRLPKKLPITAGKVHFMRRVDQDRKISLLNLSWEVPKAEPDQGVWATLTFSKAGAKLSVYDAAPDTPKRTCLALHPFPLKEPVQPLQQEFQQPILVEPSWISLAADLFRLTIKSRLAALFSTML
jgi:putative transposase